MVSINAIDDESYDGGWYADTEHKMDVPRHATLCIREVAWVTNANVSQDQTRNPYATSLIAQLKVTEANQPNIVHESRVS